LTHDGLQCAAIHGNKSQSARTRALEDFKEYKVQVLVATDIAARGLDITELPQVVNYELPHVPEDYVHRIGRTGRAGSTGQALSLVSDDERDRLRAIERVLGRKINVLPLDRTQIPRPSGEGKTREPRHVDPRAQQQRHAKPQGQRHRQGPGQGQGTGGQAHGRPGGGARRPKPRSYGSQA
jgi:ATP-dependent RNA helicase RhlE